jgi:hypothetical protein
MHTAEPAARSGACRWRSRARAGAAQTGHEAPWGLRITLISPAAFTPYSGMLPGLLAGHYSFEERTSSCSACASGPACAFSTTGDWRSIPRRRCCSAATAARLFTTCLHRYRLAARAGFGARRARARRAGKARRRAVGALAGAAPAEQTWRWRGLRSWAAAPAASSLFSPSRTAWREAPRLALYCGAVGGAAGLQPRFAAGR